MATLERDVGLPGAVVILAHESRDLSLTRVADTIPNQARNPGLWKASSFQPSVWIQSPPGFRDVTGGAWSRVNCGVFREGGGAAPPLYCSPLQVADIVAGERWGRSPPLRSSRFFGGARLPSSFPPGRGPGGGCEAGALPPPRSPTWW